VFKKKKEEEVCSKSQNRIFHFLNRSCEVDEGGSEEQFDGFDGEVDLPDIY